MTVQGSVVSRTLLPSHVLVGIPKVRRYLVVPRNGEGTVLQLFGRKARQDVGNVSGNIGSGGECDLFVAVTTNGHFPARDVEIEEPLDLWSTKQEWQVTPYIKKRTTPRCNPRTGPCRRRHRGYPKLLTGPGNSPSPSPPTFPRSLLPPLFLQTPKGRTT